MKLIDTHSHLYSEQYNEDIDTVVKTAKEVVSHIFLPNVDVLSFDQMMKLTNSDSDFFYPMLGLHPCSVKENFMEILQNWEPLFEKYKFYGVGETGLDFYWDTDFKNEQFTSLEYQINWAKKYKLPLILHTRKANKEAIDLIKIHQDSSLKGIFHCFSGTYEEGKKIVDMGFLLGVGGVVTFQNAKMAEVISKFSLENLVLETDSPYLAPHPYRGKRNETSYIQYVGHKLAEIFNTDYETIATHTSQNALNLFSPNN